MADPRWIIVSNRLPYSLAPDGDKLVQSSGGLVTAIKGIRNKKEMVWVGCAPTGVTKQKWDELYEPDKEKQVLQPVFVDEATYDAYYNGFCNDLLWPILHYESERAEFRANQWEAYKRVNELFSDAVARQARPGDMVWIHDFHLFLLPKLLREKKKSLRMGFFLHVPFPSSEIFRQVPKRKDLLEGLLASDLIGFHDYSYLRHFCSSLLQVLGIESSFLSINSKHGRTRLGVFPVSIDTAGVSSKAQSKTVKQNLKKFQSRRFVFLGVDRLDYSKGVDLKLKAYRNFLERYPQMQGKVQLVQVAVPSRTEVPDYIQLKENVDKLVGEIDGRFSTPTWSPVHYMFSSVTQDELLALYRSADALLVSSKRDGMNLVTLEYIAAQRSQSPGVVLLSEFAGAMSMLGHTLPINPWDIEGTASRMMEAVEMDSKEKVDRWKAMYDYLQNYTATDWADSFFTQLESSVIPDRSHAEVFPVNKTSINQLADKIKAFNPEKVVFLLDYDGTLVPIEKSPELARVDQKTLNTLSAVQKRGMDVVIISGRPSSFLQKEFGKGEFYLVAEHGAKVLTKQAAQWKSRVNQKKEEWYYQALQIMQDYAKRVQNSFVERKSYSIAWHYRLSPSQYASYQAKKLQEELNFGLAKYPVNVIHGKKVIEIRSIEANKGFFVSNYLDSHNSRVLAIALGDDLTDEDIFAAIQSRGISFKVGGEGSSQADFVLESQEQVVPFIENLSKAIRGLNPSSEATSSKPLDISVKGNISSPQ